MSNQNNQRKSFRKTKRPVSYYSHKPNKKRRMNLFQELATHDNNALLFKFSTMNHLFGVRDISKLITDLMIKIINYEREQAIQDFVKVPVLRYDWKQIYDKKNTTETGLLNDMIIKFKCAAGTEFTKKINYYAMNTGRFDLKLQFGI